MYIHRPAYPPRGYTDPMNRGALIHLQACAVNTGFGLFSSWAPSQCGEGVEIKSGSVETCVHTKRVCA